MWTIRGYSVKNLFLLIFAITLCTYPLYTTAEIRTFTHNEEIDYGPTALPRVWSLGVYDDGTMVSRIIRRKSAPDPGTVCFQEMLSLRIIHTNGLVEEKDIKLDIQPFNYCVTTEGPLFLEYIKIQLISNDYILVSYYNATDEQDINTYMEWGAVIDFDGNVKDRIPFGFAFIQVENGITKLVPKSEYTLNINKKKGFLRFSGVRYSRDGEWQQYQIESDGTFTKLTSGTVPFDYFTSLSLFIMSTIDEGYAVVFANTTNNFTAANPLLPQAQLFILPIGYNQTPLEPLLLYQTPVPGLTIPTIFCNIATVGIGQVCTMTVVQGSVDGTNPPQTPQTFYIKVSFLSSGSVSSFQVLNRVLPVENTNVWLVKNLPFGGYLLLNSFASQQNQFTYGYLFDEDGETPYQWEFQEPQQTNVRAIIVVLPNNTLVVAQKEINNSWQFQVTDLPKFTGGKEDKGYYNLNVNSTSPAINDIISSDIQKISIDFYDPIALSDGRLTIFQVDGDKTYLRQSIPGTLCSVENGGRTVSAKVLGSTFSASKGNYFIVMDNDFVRSGAYNEPLLGIRENVWNFATQEKKEPFAPSTTGLLRLTSNGTQLFDGLSGKERTAFFNNLLDELSLAVPVSRSRLSTSGKTQVDNSLNGKQYLISIGIKETRSEDEKSVDTVVKDIDVMVQNKDQTPIGSGEATNFLDQSYGFHPSPDLWNKYKFRLLGVFLVIGLFIVLFLFAQRRDNNGNNIAILQLGVIIFDLVMDVLFVSSNARDVPVLYIPSVVFITAPIAINTMLAFFIITQENTRPKFFQWFTAHGKVASVFTVLAGADIEALNILHSNLAGFPFFRAPFSDDAKSKIFWGACLNIFTEDIPQVVIQVYYRYNTVSYDIIPLLTLISSAVNLTINIIGRLYQATNRVRNRDVSSFDDSNDTDDFGGLTTAVSTPRESVNSDKKGLEKLEEGHGESTSREIAKSESSPQNYLGDVLKLNSEETGLSSVINDSLNNNNNLGNDPNKNQNKGMTFLKRMVSRKE